MTNPERPKITDENSFSDDYGTLMNALGFAQIVKAETPQAEKAEYSKKMIEALYQIITSLEQDMVDLLELLMPATLKLVKFKAEAVALRKKLIEGNIDKECAFPVTDAYYEVISIIHPQSEE